MAINREVLVRADWRGVVEARLLMNFRHAVKVRVGFPTEVTLGNGSVLRFDTRDYWPHRLQDDVRDEYRRLESLLDADDRSQSWVKGPDAYINLEHAVKVEFDGPPNFERELIDGKTWTPEYPLRASVLLLTGETVVFEFADAAEVYFALTDPVVADDPR